MLVVGDERAECDALRNQFTKDAVDCAAGDRVNFTARRSLVEGLGELESILQQLLPHEGLRVPWVRSPTRLIANDAAAYGLTPEKLLAPTRALQPGQDDARLLEAIQRTLANLTNATSPVVEIEEPPASTRYDYTLAQGFIHHTTDLISGLDWAHAEVATRTPAEYGVLDVKVAIQAGAGLINDQDLKDQALAFAESIQPDDAVSVGILLDALLRGPAALAEDWQARGWRPNGTLSFEGLGLENDVAGQPVQPPDCQAQAALLEGVPLGFIPPAACAAVVSVAQPRIQTTGGLDHSAAAFKYQVLPATSATE